MTHEGKGGGGGAGENQLGFQTQLADSVETLRAESRAELAEFMTVGCS